MGELDTKSAIDNFMLNTNFIHKDISLYGKSSGSEALAEIWALYKKEGKAALNADWIEFFNNYSPKVKI